MTTTFAVAVKDSAVQAFNRPFFTPTIPAAVRSFTDEVNRVADDNAMYKHPDDFELWVVAAFDDETGVFQPVEIRCVCRAKDVRQA